MSSPFDAHTASRCAVPAFDVLSLSLNKESTKENNAGIQFSAYGNVLLPAPEEFCKAKFFP
jgi:hypothetical protein